MLAISVSAARSASAGVSASQPDCCIIGELTSDAAKFCRAMMVCDVIQFSPPGQPATLGG